MRILALYPNAEGYSRIPTGMAIIVTLLSRAGHELKVFDTTFMTGTNVDNSIRENAQLVKPTQADYGYENMDEQQIREHFGETVRGFDPDLLIVTIIEDNYRFAHSLMKVAKTIKPSLIVLAGGPTPSAAPDVIIENPCIDYVVQGEGEESALEFCDSLERGRSVEDIQNLWYKKKDQVLHNPLRPFIDMNTVPFQDFSFWDERHLIKPYDGRIYRTGYVETSRGCPHSCTYCVNHAIRKSLRDCGHYYRRKDFELVIDELKEQKEKLQIERVVFCDDNFLLCKDEQVQAFSDLWKRYVDLPYWITTSAEYVNPRKLSFLKESGCDGIGLGVEAGGEWFRTKILLRTVTNRKLVDTFRLIHEFGIRTTANFMIGFPGEHEVDVFESIKLMKQLEPRSFDISFVSPYIGTKIHILAQKLGLIDIEDVPGFRGMARNVSFRGKPSIRNPHIDEDRLVQLYYDAMEYVKGSRQIPDQFLPSAPGAHGLASPRGDLSRQESEIISQIN
jgi:anaerobic magnesium-protoporphyrin IX monomethyl ester cyclase